MIEIPEMLLIAWLCLLSYANCLTWDLPALTIYVWPAPTPFGEFKL